MSFISHYRATAIAILVSVLTLSFYSALAADSQKPSAAKSPSDIATRFLRLSPDKAAADKSLVAYATTIATPAYAANCASCHGADLRGDRAKGVPDLTDGDWLHGAGELSAKGDVSEDGRTTVYDIEKIIRYGIRSDHPKTWNLAIMPAYGHSKPSPTAEIPQLTQAEINDLVEYLLSLEKRSTNAAAAKRGADLYSDKAGCFDCHGADAMGDPPVGAPNLTDNIWLYGDGSRTAIYQVIFDGRHGVCPAWVNKLKPETIRALAVYIYSSYAAGPASSGVVH